MLSPPQPNYFPLPGSFPPWDGPQQRAIDTGPDGQVPFFRHPLMPPPIVAPYTQTEEPKPIQLAYDPEIFARDRTPFKTLGPFAECIRVGFLTKHPRSTLPPGMPPPPILDPFFTPLPFYSVEGFPHLYVDEPAEDWTSQWELEGRPTASIDETLSPILSDQLHDLPPLPISLMEGHDNTTSPRRTVAFSSARTTSKLHDPPRRRSNSLDSPRPRGILRNPTRRRTKSLERPRLKGILRNRNNAHNQPMGVGRPARTVHFAANTQGSGDSQSSTSRESSISEISFSSSRSSSTQSTTTTTTQFSASSSTLAFAASSHYFASPATVSAPSSRTSSRGYDADLESPLSSVSSSPRWEAMSPPHSALSSPDSASPFSWGSILSHYLTDSPVPGPQRPESPTVAVNHQQLAHNLSGGLSPQPTSQRATLRFAYSNPTEDNGVSQIVSSLSRSTSELVRAVVSGEPQPSSQAGGADATTSFTRFTTTAARFGSPGIASASTLTAMNHETPLNVSAGQTPNQPDPAFNIFPDANHFEMRDPNFHIAQRDVQIVNVYNITLNQLQATSTHTTAVSD